MYLLITQRQAARQPCRRLASLAGTFLFIAGVASAQVISNVSATSVTSQSAVVTWTTNLPASSTVNYGITTTYGASSSVDPTQTLTHSVLLGGLAANTLYNFNVV